MNQCGRSLQEDLPATHHSVIGVTLKEYLAVEKQIGGSESEDAVLVSVDSVASLHRAYPNYFLDMAVFSDLIDEMVGKKET